MFKVYDMKTERFYALKVMTKKKDKEENTQELLKNTSHEIRMALEIMKMRNKHFVNLVAF